MGGEDSVVWFDNAVAHRRRRVNAEFKLRLLAIVGGETLKKQGAEAGTVGQDSASA